MRLLSPGVVGAVAMEALVDKLRGALWGSLAGDALAMPVHWYVLVSCMRQSCVSEQVQ